MVLFSVIFIYSLLLYEFLTISIIGLIAKRNIYTRIVVLMNTINLYLDNEVVMFMLLLLVAMKHKHDTDLSIREIIWENKLTECNHMCWCYLISSSFASSMLFLCLFCYGHASADFVQLLLLLFCLCLSSLPFPLLLFLFKKDLSKPWLYESYISIEHITNLWQSTLLALLWSSSQKLYFNTLNGNSNMCLIMVMQPQPWLLGSCVPL